MNRSRLLFVAVSLALCAGLSWGSGTASATALCAENEESCSSENTFGIPAQVSLSLKAETESLFDAGGVEVTCAVSTAEGELTEESGSALVGEVTELSFSSCSEECTAEAQNLPYAAELSATSEGNGTLTIGNGGSGNPGAVISCLGIECTYGAASGIELSAAGGEPGTLTAEKAELSKESGFFLCGSTGKWSATYDVGPYESLYLAEAGEPTILCKTAPTKDKTTGELLCKKEERFIGEITGSLRAATKAKFTDVGEPKNAIECTESTLAGIFGANGGSGIGGGVTGITFNSGGGKECTSTIPGAANVSLSVENPPWDNSKISYLQAEPKPHGTMAIRKRKAATKLKLVAGGSTCSYEPVELYGTIANAEGASPTYLATVHLWKITAKKAPCPEEMAAFIEWGITQKAGGNVYVTEREEP